ncbi:MAG: AMP-binding protein [Betaproteobacteria bacterium]
MSLDDTLAWRPDGPVTVRVYLGDALCVAGSLPAGDWLLNLCEDRYHFAVVFAACLLCGKTSLQPASHSVETLERLAQTYPAVFCVTDGDFDSRELPRLRFSDLAKGPVVPVHEIPSVDAQRVVAILFTSGSTGLPQPHGKTWGQLVINGHAEAMALGLAGSGTALVGTVPVQHSYGFESTFLLALHGGCSFWSGKPFYPQDVVDALMAVPRPRMLVTTPHHLATLLASELDMPAMDMCLSATAPLSGGLAARAEERLGAPVFEIYGSTESSQLASRRTTEGAAWQLLPGVTLEQDPGDACTITHAVGGHVEGRVALSDIIELLPNGRFHLNGRHADMVDIAGKRTSLAYLNHQLCAIDGVQDAAFFLPSHDAAETITRLTAFVVAPGVSRSSLLTALRLRLDPVFLPRPLVRVDALPRNSTGKLPRSALETLYREQVRHGAG